MASQSVYKVHVSTKFQIDYEHQHLCMIARSNHIFLIVWAIKTTTTKAVLLEWSESIKGFSLAAGSARAGAMKWSFHCF